MNKRALISFLLLFVFSFAVAQNRSSNHLSFKGIPLDGSIASFTAQMKEIGYEEMEAGDEDYRKCFTGDFIGKYSTIFVSYSPSGLVYRIDVIQKSSSRSGVRAAINEVKDLYTSKYGRAESFDEVHTWTVDYGGIVVMPDTDSPAVRIVYEDEKNAEMAFKEKASQKNNKKKQYLDDI